MTNHLGDFLPGRWMLSISCQLQAAPTVDAPDLKVNDMIQPQESTRFRRANERIAHLVDDPLIADQVSEFAAERHKVNQIHARGLADVRKASNLTQQQVAEELGTDQGSVSKIERREDLLLSTLRQYLAATGVVRPRIVVEKDGVEITLELDTFSGSVAP